MTSTFTLLSRLVIAGVLAASASLPLQAGELHPAVKRPFNPAPSADLNYALKARFRGIPLEGSGVVKWRAGSGKFQVSVDASAAVFGKVQSSSSEGLIDSYGLAPVTAVEKSFRKKPTTVTFDRSNNTLTFSASSESYPLLGGEQDRASILWQLVGNARASAKKFTSGSSWMYFVAGRTDAHAWTFKVGKTEKITTPMGSFEAVKIARLLEPGSREQQLDIWLAPSLEWYPVKLRFSEPDGEVIEQTLASITRK
ncbi:uncharacterized protein DUF3108 [Paucimonas lemoignei]|uniref:Uncharacterized protein DUF3108 n=1 Tax=Paucimonas lemoignei TaxID=29443 RepID=A0A4R3HYK1_PAULE|nr:DUF3108 domain-containing protein [Paucimonas lemoignei]TCS37753.1 uncharacterized protein DUF3108 [Paucimonas lemoignei]